MFYDDVYCGMGKQGVDAGCGCRHMYKGKRGVHVMRSLMLGFSVLYCLLSCHEYSIQSTIHISTKSLNPHYSKGANETWSVCFLTASS